MNNLINFIYPKEYLNKKNEKILELGLDTKINLNNFLISRIVLEMILFIVLLLIPKYGFVLGICGIIFFRILYEDIIINSKIINREKKMANDCKMFLEFFLLSLMSDKNIYDCLIGTCSIIDNSLTKEINNLNNISSLKKMFVSLSKRVPNEDIKDMFIGFSIAKDKDEYVNVINKELLYLNEIKDRNLDKKINMLPWKIILNIIIFLTIVIGLLIVGPKML